jgi:hypothetical protein
MRALSFPDQPFFARLRRCSRWRFSFSMPSAAMISGTRYG